MMKHGDEEDHLVLETLTEDSEAGALLLLHGKMLFLTHSAKGNPLGGLYIHHFDRVTFSHGSQPTVLKIHHKSKVKNFGLLGARNFQNRGRNGTVTKAMIHRKRSFGRCEWPSASLLSLISKLPYRTLSKEQSLRDG